MQPNTLVLQSMKYTDWQHHLTAVEHWIGFSLKKGQEVEDRSFICCLHSTLDDELKDKCQDFLQVETKEETIALLDDIFPQFFPLHICCVQALNEHKTDIEDCLVYIERIKTMYDKAKLENVTKEILILHQAFQEIMLIEAHKKIRDTISTNLS